MSYEIVVTPQVTTKVVPSYQEPRWRYTIYGLNEDGTRNQQAARTRYNTNWTSVVKKGTGWTKSIATFKARWFRFGLDRRARIKKQSELRVQRHQAELEKSK